MYALAMSTNFLRHVLSLIILLRCFQESLSGPVVKVLLYFLRRELMSLFPYQVICLKVADQFGDFELS